MSNEELEDYSYISDAFSYFRSDTVEVFHGDAYALSSKQWQFDPTTLNGASNQKDVKIEELQNDSLLAINESQKSEKTNQESENKTQVANVIKEDNPIQSHVQNTEKQKETTQINSSCMEMVLYDSEQNQTGRTDIGNVTNSNSAGLEHKTSHVSVISDIKIEPSQHALQPYNSNVLLNSQVSQHGYERDRQTSNSLPYYNYSGYGNNVSMTSQMQPSKDILCQSNNIQSGHNMYETNNWNNATDNIYNCSYTNSNKSVNTKGWDNNWVDNTTNVTQQSLWNDQSSFLNNMQSYQYEPTFQQRNQQLSTTNTQNYNQMSPYMIYNKNNSQYSSYQQNNGNTNQASLCAPSQTTINLDKKKVFNQCIFLNNNETNVEEGIVNNTINYSNSQGSFDQYNSMTSPVSITPTINTQRQDTSFSYPYAQNSIQNLYLTGKQPSIANNTSNPLSQLLPSSQLTNRQQNMYSIPQVSQSSTQMHTETNLPYTLNNSNSMVESYQNLSKYPPSYNQLTGVTQISSNQSNTPKDVTYSLNNSLLSQNSQVGQYQKQSTNFQLNNNITDQTNMLSYDNVKTNQESWGYTQTNNTSMAQDKYLLSKYNNVSSNTSLNNSVNAQVLPSYTNYPNSTQNSQVLSKYLNTSQNVSKNNLSVSQSNYTLPSYQQAQLNKMSLSSNTSSNAFNLGQRSQGLPKFQDSFQGVYVNNLITTKVQKVTDQTTDFLFTQGSQNSLGYENIYRAQTNNMQVASNFKNDTQQKQIHNLTLPQINQELINYQNTFAAGQGKPLMQGQSVQLTPDQSNRTHNYQNFLPSIQTNNLTTSQANQSGLLYYSQTQAVQINAQILAQNRPASRAQRTNHKQSKVTYPYSTTQRQYNKNKNPK